MRDVFIPNLGDEYTGTPEPNLIAARFAMGTLVRSFGPRDFRTCRTNFREVSYVWLFKRVPDTQLEYNALQKYLREEWRMKPLYITALLDAYRLDICEKHRAAVIRQQQSESSASAVDRLQANAYDSTYVDTALVAQAHQGFLRDLRRGVHVDTDVELAIWAILISRSDILEHFDRGLVNFTYDKYEERFPLLFERVFDRSAEQA